MKKKILLTIMVCVPVILIILAVVSRGKIQPSNEQIIDMVKNIDYYETKVEYVIKNSRGEEREETKQYYLKDLGTKIDFTNISKIYKDDEILVKDNILNKEYKMNEDMDILYKVAFINNLLSYPIEEGSIKNAQEEWGETEYIEFLSDISLDNEHLDKIKVFINKNDKCPIGAVIYDKKGQDRVRIVYKEFTKMKQLDSELLK